MWIKWGKLRGEVGRGGDFGLGAVAMGMAMRKLRKILGGALMEELTAQGKKTRKIR